MADLLLWKPSLSRILMLTFLLERRSWLPTTSQSAPLSVRSSSRGVTWCPMVVPKVLRSTTLSELATSFVPRTLTQPSSRVSSLKLMPPQSCLKMLHLPSSPVWIRSLLVTSNLLTPGLNLTLSNSLAVSSDFSTIPKSPCLSVRMTIYAKHV